jgi:flagellar hook-associated protein 2
MATTSITTALGAGSGVDTAALVKSLVEAQFAGKTARLTKQTETITSQISGVSTIKSAITGFAGALSALVKGGSLATSPTSSNTGIVTATALSGAKLAGLSSTIEVRQLARSQVATSPARADMIASVGLGSFTLTFGQATVSDGAMTGFTASKADAISIPITQGNSGLSGIARAINAANAGVTATVLTDADGSRLSIKGPTGEAKAFTLTATEDPAAPGLSALNIGPGATGTAIGSSAQDAIVAVDGTALKRSGNSITDLLPGVKLDLVSASVGTKVSLGTSAPTTALSQAVNDFVETFNQLSSVLKQQTDPVTGALRSDGAATTLQRSLRGLTVTPLVSGSAQGAPATLAEIGVKTNRDGTLSVDAAALSTGLAKYPQVIEAMFADGTAASGTGISSALTTISNAAINTATGLGASTSRYTKMQGDIAENQAKLTDAGDVMTKRLTAQFAASEARVAAYKSTLAMLEQQVDAWNHQS